MAQSTSSGFHTHASWGRTRRPKNVNGASSTTHITSTTAYFTENQRFLHLVCDGTANITKVEVYYHGTGVWSELVEAVDADGGPGSGTQSIIVAAAMTRIIEIAGVDKIRVTVANDGSEGNRAYALLSTF
jgi:hypothetical protein